MKRRQENHRAESDERQIHTVLAEYGNAHPKAKIAIQRQNSVSIRVRIVDHDFRGLDLVERDSLIWSMLEKLPEEVLSRITLLLLLTPEETKKSFANFEFDHPIPSTF